MYNFILLNKLFQKPGFLLFSSLVSHHLVTSRNVLKIIESIIIVVIIQIGIPINHQNITPLIKFLIASGFSKLLINIGFIRDKSINSIFGEL